jgi:transposase-like protein
MGTLAGERKEKREGSVRLKMGGSPDPNRSGRVEVVGPDPEVGEKAVRRRFSAKYKHEILRRVAAACTTPGEVGKILRREGLYSSNLTTWRKQQEQGILEGLNPKKRGRKATPKNPLEDELKTVRRDVVRLQRKLEQAETIIDIQKKVSALLGIPLETPESGESD